MTNEVLSNQTNLTADFNTGPLKHAIVTGMELAWERQLNANASRTPGTAAAGPIVPGDQTNLYYPNPNDPASPLPVLPGAAEAHVDTIAFYLFDTINIGEKIKLSGGVRYDHIEAEARGLNGTPGFTNTDDLFSWKAGIVY